VKNRQQLLVIAAIALAVIFIGDKLIVPPLVDSWKSRNERIAKLTDQVERGRTLVQKEQQIRQNWDHMRTNTLATDQSVAEKQLFNALAYWASDSRVNILAIRPQWKPVDDYLLLECRVEANGTMNNISKFIYNVEKDSLALKMESVELSTRDNAGQQMMLGLQVSGLVLNPSLLQ
jgi:hypothetical protein